jgi:ankyrin repeat protein
MSYKSDELDIGEKELEQKIMGEEYTLIEVIDKIKDLDKLDRLLTRVHKKMSNGWRFNSFMTKLNVINNEYVRAIGHAIITNNIKLVELLIKHGSDVNEICWLATPSLTPLCTAVHTGNIEMIDFLLKNGADKSLRESCAPFEVAVDTNNFEVAEFLVKQGVPLYAKEGWGTQPPDLKKLLCKAVINDNVKLAELIIKHGGDKYINEKYDSFVDLKMRDFGSRIRLLVVALKNKSKDMIRLLLSHHADPYLYRYDEDDEDSPVNYAETMGEEWVTFLIGKDGYEEKKRKDKKRWKEQEKARKRHERMWRNFTQNNSNSEEQSDSDSEEEKEEKEEFQTRSASLPPKKYLEIPTEGTIEEKWKNIKKQFLKLSLKHHPDKGGDENEFKAMSNEFDAIKEYMRRTYEDKIDVFHGGKRKQSTRKKLRNNKKRGKSMRR